MKGGGLQSPQNWDNQPQNTLPQASVRGSDTFYVFAVI